MQVCLFVERGHALRPRVAAHLTELCADVEPGHGGACTWAACSGRLGTAGRPWRDTCLGRLQGPAASFWGPRRCSGHESRCMQVTLKLCTNIEPRHGGRLDMSSLLWTSGAAGRPWEYTGPVSLLKSALQKNVRRGRAEEAVRCASAATRHPCPSLLPGSCQKV